MDEEPIHFDDPDLKAAIARIRGGHKARQDVVDRVRRSLVEAIDGGARHAPAASRQVWRMGYRPMPRRFAVAASIVAAFALGVLSHRVAHKFAEAQEYIEANNRLFQAMIAAHQGTFSRPEAFGPVSNPASVRQQLADRLAHEVPLPDLSAQGWTLREAAVVQVAALPAARCVFSRGGSTLTLLSLPSAAFAGAEDGQTYQTVVDGHPLAGFIRGGGVHCVVGDAGTPLGDVTPLTDRLRRS
jgi:anti-sigma factor RsiW